VPGLAVRFSCWVVGVGVWLLCLAIAFWLLILAGVLLGRLLGVAVGYLLVLHFILSLAS
jgi:hypothetical protein